MAKTRRKRKHETSDHMAKMRTLGCHVKFRWNCFVCEHAVPAVPAVPKPCCPRLLRMQMLSWRPDILQHPPSSWRRVPKYNFNKIQLQYSSGFYGFYGEAFSIIFIFCSATYCSMITRDPAFCQILPVCSCQSMFCELPSLPYCFQ